ncbi:13291_t:CDS:1 [Ambispora gerdemannii]|uniref:13291_t:CDS:1 n=1 Tax=Ambispora gerdemannii TaxID=144530 RepID=A0A9N9AC98_9GLOM|nr:13291_t:CDS:1 [Ambispora gerdemannii]
MLNSVFSAKYAYLNYNELLILSKYSYQLTLSIEELTKPARKRGNSDKPPRPQNSWIIFRRDYEAHLRLCNQDVKQKVKETAKECSLKWQELSSEIKPFFKILEKIAYENHKSLYPRYRYKPKNAKDSSIKKWVFREQKKYAPTSSHKPSSTSNNSPPQEQIVRSSSLNSTTSTIEYNHTIITISKIIDDAHLSTNNANVGNSINNAFDEIISLDQFPLSGHINVNNNADSTTIDDTHLFTINTSNDVGNSFNAFNEIISLDQFPILSGNVDTCINFNNHADSITINDTTINTCTNSINMSKVNVNEIISILNLSGNVNNADIYEEASINNASNNNSSQPNQFITNNPITPSLSQLFIPEYDILNINFEELLYDNFS